MDKNLRWRAIAILAVVAISIWGFYPPTEKVKLGLDLKGGVHLVLRVQTDDALRLDTETTMEQLREAVEAKGLVNVTFTGVDPTRFRVDAVPQEQDAAFREAAGEVETRFNRESGTAGSYSFVMKPNMAVQLREDAVEQALQTIERRVNELGVAEPVVARTGAAGDHILVQLPGVENPQRAKDIIRSTALLELKIVEDGPASTREQLLQTRGGVVPGNMEILPGVSDTAAPGDRAETVYYLVRKVAVVTGRDLRNAKPSLDEMNRPAVSFSLNTDGARKFGKATGENVGRHLAIILDGRVQSAPVIESRIFDEGRISGTFTQQEVQDLSLVLRSGALPASLTYLEERTVGPSLGAESIRSGVTAALGGLLLVVIFLLFYYKLSGLNALAAMVINLIVLLGHDVLLRGGDDAARHRGLHPDHRHGRRLERPDLRAHQGGAGRPEGRQAGDRRRLRPRVPDDPRHPRRLAHRGSLPVPVRHGPHPRLRHHAVDRSPVERVHVRVRLADIV